MNYIENHKKYSKNNIREVNIGNIPLGNLYSVRVQSMTNTDTNDIEKSVEQCVALINEGAEYIRLTTQGIREVDSLIKIKEVLRNKGYQTPLIADVHFNPKVAEYAAQHVEKIRINPGNYSDKNIGKTEFSDEEYVKELKRIEKNLIPLIKICQKHKTAIRIGINHGSLSERIISRFGDTPEGMVMSALEFISIFRENNFNDIVISMKASNVRIMVYACRLLVSKMKENNYNYPLHLGVTEAGSDDEGRIKSAVGIGALLNDGIGDTIRVSLTEDPVKEIPVAKKIVDHCCNKNDHENIIGTDSFKYNPFEYSKRKTYPFSEFEFKQPLVVTEIKTGKNEFLNTDQPDFYYLSDKKLINKIPKSAKIIMEYTDWISGNECPLNCFPILDYNTFLKASEFSERINFVRIVNREYEIEFFKKCVDTKTVLLLTTENINAYADYRSFFNSLIDIKMEIPVIISRKYSEADPESFQIKASCDIGPLFIDGFGEGIFLQNTESIPENIINSTAFGILQAARVRISKTEYISCPGCGRTLFNLQETLQEIKKKTSHLKGIKIGVMGCIVNGPGEMADADYGYVGAGKGKITLYKNKEVIKKNIPENCALNELIQLIKDNGDWK